MADVKVELKRSLTRQQAADRLSALASALAQGGEVELDLDGATVSLRIPDDMRSEFEVEVDGDELELELEFKWSMARAEGLRAGSAERAAGGSVGRMPAQPPAAPAAEPSVTSG